MIYTIALRTAQTRRASSDVPRGTSSHPRPPAPRRRSVRHAGSRLVCRCGGALVPICYISLESSAPPSRTPGGGAGPLGRESVRILAPPRLRG